MLVSVSPVESRFRGPHAGPPERPGALADRGQVPTRQDGEDSRREFELVVQHLAADLRPRPGLSRIERLRRLFFPQYGARANAADAWVAMVEVNRVRGEMTGPDRGRPPTRPSRPEDVCDSR
ncbi:MAG: hypothetical protein EOP32_18170 [Rhodococcus sp. (in: high G+C Gram-positive bacteria)]|nr:MAG: hypothetical protein EOP32_18170 [Rhodococcus sp. (in: high G+C Gram-positive bacteria)]